MLGLECCGKLVLNPEELGSQAPRLSDETYIALLSGGGYAEYAKVNKDHIIRIPEGYDLIKAACITEVFATAF